MGKKWDCGKGSRDREKKLYINSEKNIVKEIHCGKIDSEKNIYVLENNIEIVEKASKKNWKKYIHILKKIHWKNIDNGKKNVDSGNKYRQWKKI